MGMTTDFLFDEPLASQLEAMRALARAKRRIIYDCAVARVTDDGQDVICTKGNQLRGRPSVNLRAVFRGVASSTCQQCPDHDSRRENDN